MKTRTQSILSIVRIVALIGYIGAIIHALRIIIPVVAGFANDLLYRLGFLKEQFSISTGTGFDSLKNNHNIFPYIGAIGFAIAIVIIQVEIWEKLRKILTEIDLNSPFSMKVASMIEKMSGTILSLWIVNMVADISLRQISKSVDVSVNSGYFKSDFQFLLAAGIIYVLAQVFKRGVELQDENEMTV